MIELPNLRPETRYGMPAADRYLFNRQYIIPNSEDLDADLSSFLVPTDQVESRAGLTLWDRLRGEKIDESEAKAGNMWEY
jgi:hypothetical protein